MYERDLGTDWSGPLAREQLLGRAYALGVAVRLEQAPEGELDRLLKAADSGYERNLVKLAYEEGQTEAHSKTSESAETLWEELVSERAAVELEPTAQPTDTSLPGALDRQAPDSRPHSTKEVIRLPAFLRRTNED